MLEHIKFLDSDKRNFSADYFNELHKAMIEEAKQMKNEEGIGGQPENIGLFASWVYGVARSHAMNDAVNGKFHGLIQESKQLKNK